MTNLVAYYQDDSVTLYHGNALEIDEWLQADVLVTDPPYGIDGHLSSDYKGKRPPGGHVRTNAKPDWDVTLEARNAVVAAWGDRPYAIFASPSRLDDPLPFREFPLIWDKGSVGMGDVTFPWGRGYELIFVNGKGWHGKRESPIIRVLHSPTAVAKAGHPTPKPIGLMGRLIDKCPPGVIADPFAGSGSTLVAAKYHGRQSIGVEIEERYCELIANRLSQGVLDFGEVPA